MTLIAVSKTHPAEDVLSAVHVGLTVFGEKGDAIMSKKLGNLIKEARTNKGLSQASLAEQVDGITASDVGKIERGEKEPAQDVIKQIAKVLGVTQKSLLDAATGKTTAAKTTSGKTAARKTAKAEE